MYLIIKNYHTTTLILKIGGHSSNVALIHKEKATINFINKRIGDPRIINGLIPNAENS